MPNLYKNILGKLRRPSTPELNALVLGLDNAGKSSVLSRIISDNAEDVRLSKFVTAIAYEVNYLFS